MSIDDSELREYTHGLFGSIAGVLKQDFQPFLATCVAAALASCNQVTQQQQQYYWPARSAHMHQCKYEPQNVQQVCVWMYARSLNIGV